VSVLYDQPVLTVPIGPDDHVDGPSTAPVTLLEYGDYECPFCGAAYESIEQLRRILSDDVRFAYRHFPLTQIHPHAFAAAEAAEAAGAQGRFWEMHHMLFTHQDRLAPTDLNAYAREIGLDLGRFTRELSDQTYAAVVRGHFMSGVRSGVNGTPTFFVNGYRHNGGYDVPSLFGALTAAISSS
jgi:protein-disulfide isomerase